MSGWPGSPPTSPLPQDHHAGISGFPFPFPLSSPGPASRSGSASPVPGIATLPSSLFAGFSILTALRWDPILKDHPDCQYGKPLYMLSYHRERLLNATRYFNDKGTFMEGAGKWGGVIEWLEDEVEFERDIVEGVRACGEDLEGPLRIRITLPIPKLSSTPSTTADGLSSLPAPPKFLLLANPIPPVPLKTLFPTTLPHPLHPTTPSSTASDWTLHIDSSSTIPTPLTSYKTTARRHYDFSRNRCALPPIGSPGSNNEVIMYNPHGDVMEGSFTTLYFWRKDEGGWITPDLSAGGCEATMRRWVLGKELAIVGVIQIDDVRRGEWVVMSNGVRGVWGGWVV